MKERTVVRNNVKVSGHGTQPMRFAHGFGCDQNMWRFVAPAFEHDDRVVLFDYLGSGHSRRGDGTRAGDQPDLARGMGGELTATSVVGEGSVFTLELAAVAPE